MSEQGTDEFLDVRPSEEDDSAGGAGETDDAGGEDMVFLDEIDGPPAAAPPRPAAPPPARPNTPPPRAAADVSPRTPPPGRPRAESGRAPRPGSEPPRPAPQGVGRPPSGGPRPVSQGDVEPGSRTSSGRLRTLQKSSTSPTGSGKQGRPTLRPERSPEEDAAALAALEARLQPTPANDPWIGRDLGPFKVERFVELDRGERRYIAQHGDSQRPVLLRVFPLSGSYGDEFKRLADRAERPLRVESQSLDSALAVGRTKEAFFAGFEPPAGPTVTQLLETGPLPEAEVLAMIDQVSKALGALHTRELTHTHLSPDVIRRPRPGTYVLEAAGLARPRPALSFLGAGGDVLGRPGFIAPETVDGGEHTRASDLYSLGCVAWTALVGKPPFVGDDEVQVLLDQLNHELPKLIDALPQRTPVSEPAQTIVGKLAGYTPDVRYRDLHDLAADLKAREKGERITPFAPTLRPDDLRPRTKVKGVTVSLIVLGVLNAILLTLVGLTILKARAVKLESPTDGYELPLPPGPK